MLVLRAIVDAAFIGEKVIRIQSFVPQKFVSRAVDHVGTGFHDQVHYAGRSPSVFRRKAVGLHAKLLHGLHRNTVVERWNAGTGELDRRSIHVNVSAVPLATVNLVRPESADHLSGVAGYQRHEVHRIANGSFHRQRQVEDVVGSDCGRDL